MILCKFTTPALICVQGQVVFFLTQGTIGTKGLSTGRKRDMHSKGKIRRRKNGKSDLKLPGHICNKKRNQNSF